MVLDLLIPDSSLAVVYGRGLWVGVGLGLWLGRNSQHSFLMSAGEGAKDTKREQEKRVLPRREEGWASEEG